MGGASLCVYRPDSEHGLMRNFVGDTVSAFQKAGCRLYNSCVMLLPFNTLPVRAGKAMASSAKLGMCHQHVLVFYKGRAPNNDQGVAHVDFHPGAERDGVARALRAAPYDHDRLFLTTKVRMVKDANVTPAEAAARCRAQLDEDRAALGVRAVDMCART